MNLKICFFAALCAISLSNHAQSVKCDRAFSSVEKQICASPALKALDVQVSSEFSKTLLQSNNDIDIKAEHDNWIKNSRNTCKDSSCLEIVYNSRLNQLVVQQTKIKPATQTTPVKRIRSNTFVVYKEFDNDVPNPDRGFWKQTKSKNTFFSETDPYGTRVVRNYFIIDEFVDKPFSKEILDELDKNLSEKEEAGISVIPRWTYHWPAVTSSIGGIINETEPIKTANPQLMLKHIEQLASVLRKHERAIAYIETGLIGWWGEQHGDTPYKQSDEFMRTLVEKWLTELDGTNIHVAVRYSSKWKNLTGDRMFSTPIKADISKIGMYNDCIADKSDQLIKDSVSHSKLSKVPMGGEMCEFPPRTDYSCSTMTEYFRKNSFDTLNIGYYKGILDKWKKDGCYKEIEKRLGYRFVLKESKLDSNGLLTFKIANVGWGKSFKSRKVSFTVNGKTINTEIDAKNWLPGNEYVEHVNLGRIPNDGATITINIEGGVILANETGNEIL